MSCEASLKGLRGSSCLSCECLHVFPAQGFHCTFDHAFSVPTVFIREKRTEIQNPKAFSIPVNHLTILAAAAFVVPSSQPKPCLSPPQLCLCALVGRSGDSADPNMSFSFNFLYLNTVNHHHYHDDKGLFESDSTLSPSCPFSCLVLRTILRGRYTSTPQFLEIQRNARTSLGRQAAQCS